MWIIKSKGKYVYFGTIDDFTWDLTTDRDKAKQFDTRQEAKDFMAKYSITGSVIPY